MPKLYAVTPLLLSTPLSRILGRRVWLKLENTQPAGSFKSRGMGRACEIAVAKGAGVLVTSSGGNAGLAVAYAGKILGVPVLVVVPSRTSERMRALIAAEGAEVIVSGDVWDDAHARATEEAARRGGALVHPFDAPEVWEGHATLVHEIIAEGVTPSAVVLSVGGGGLLCGVAQGLQDAALPGVPIVAAETVGAASYARAIAAGHPVTLPSIDSVALTLGAKRVCDASVAWSKRRPISPWLTSDASAVSAVLRFLDDHRMLVEPACGAALAAIYGLAEPLREGGEDVVVIVCGGAASTREQLDLWVTAAV